MLKKQAPLEPSHPLNGKIVHDIMLDDKLEQTKEIDDLKTSDKLGLFMNKHMKCVKAFKRHEGTLKGEDQIYYNTYRNGFVSTIAMSYNFHMPLILSPNDIWLTVMQGFKLHIRQ